MSQPLSVACFGAAHVDIKAQAKAKVVMGSSNPAQVLRRITTAQQAIERGFTRGRIGQDWLAVLEG